MVSVIESVAAQLQERYVKILDDIKFDSREDLRSKKDVTGLSDDEENALNELDEIALWLGIDNRN